MAGRSIVSNSWRRLTPRRRISRPFIRSSATPIAALHSAREKGKESHVAQATKNIGLGKAHAGLHFGFVFWLAWPCRYNTDVVVRCHFTVTEIYFGIVERGLVDPTPEIVRDQQSRRRTKEPEHPHMCANPVRKALRPGGVGKGEV